MSPVPGLFVSNLLSCPGNINSIPTIRELIVLVCSLPSHSTFSLILAHLTLLQVHRNAAAPACTKVSQSPEPPIGRLLCPECLPPSFPLHTLFLLLVSAGVSTDSSGLRTSHLSWIEGICWLALHIHFPSSLEGSSWIPQFRKFTPS